MKILAIVVTYNGMKWIQRCLDSIVNSSVRLDAFVVDNGSRDGTQEYIRSNYPEMLLVESLTNLGFGKANNIGVRYALEQGYDYVYLLNQDAWLMQDTVERLVESMALYPEYGILSPMQFEANLQRLDVRFANRIGGFSRQGDIITVPYVMAAHWLISRRCLVTAGLFSPIFPHYGEDENYCERVLYWGFKIGVLTTTSAVHDRESRALDIEKKVYMNYYMKTVCCLSSISRPVFLPRLQIFTNATAYSLRYCTLLPFRYIKNLLQALPDIQKSRTETKNPGAFI